MGHWTEREYNLSLPSFRGGLCGHFSSSFEIDTYFSLSLSFTHLVTLSHHVLEPADCSRQVHVGLAEAAAASYSL